MVPSHVIHKHHPPPTQPNLKKVEDSKLAFILDDMLDFERDLFKWNSRDETIKDIALSKTVQDLKNRITSIDAFIAKVKQMARETTLLQKKEEQPSNILL
jgi:hypothetical protein